MPDPYFMAAEIMELLPRAAPHEAEVLTQLRHWRIDCGLSRHQLFLCSFKNPIDEVIIGLSSSLALSMASIPQYLARRGVHGCGIPYRG